MLLSMLSGGQNSLACSGVEPLVVDAVAAVGMDMALEHLDVVHRVRQHHHAARREHDVVVQFLREVFPQLERMVVERGAFVEQVVGADDGGVAPGVAAADPALLEHRDVRETVFLGEIVRGSQAMPAAADDDGIVARLGLRPCAIAAASRDGPKGRAAAAPARRRFVGSWRSHYDSLGPQFLVLRIVGRVDEHRCALALAEDLDLQMRADCRELRLDIA